MVLKARRALLAVGLQAGRVLRADTDTVAHFDALLGILANTNGFADDLVADAACYVSLSASAPLRMVGMLCLLTVRRWEPARAQCVKVRATDTAVRDLDVDIVLRPGLNVWEGTPFHLALCRLWALAQPSLKTLFLRHCYLLLSLVKA